jgi:hypothetical protein
MEVALNSFRGGLLPSPINRLEAALVRLKQMRGEQVRRLNTERNSFTHGGQ